MGGGDAQKLPTSSIDTTGEGKTIHCRPGLGRLSQAGLFAFVLVHLFLGRGAEAMKLIHKEISKEGGRVSLVPEDAEDLWTVYNLIVSAAFSESAFLVGVAFLGPFHKGASHIQQEGEDERPCAVCPMCGIATAATRNTTAKSSR